MDPFIPPPPLLPDVVSSQQMMQTNEDILSPIGIKLEQLTLPPSPPKPRQFEPGQQQLHGQHQHLNSQHQHLQQTQQYEHEHQHQQQQAAHNHQHPQQQQQQQQHLNQHPAQLPDIVPEKVVEEFEIIMSNETDKVVLTNSICLLFRFSIDSVRGFEVCQAMSASPVIMSRLYYVLTDDEFAGDDIIICYATGNLTNISKYEQGRAAILSSADSSSYFHHSNSSNLPSEGVKSLLRSLQSRDSNVVIFAITAIHNLLLDRNFFIQDMAKEQIKHGIRYIVQLLDNKCLVNNYEFKVIVLDCLQILAYGNNDNRLAIRVSGGPYLILRTIQENLDNQPIDELIETASRVLKSLSACPENKKDIIECNGIDILTNCIKCGNHEILKTCLWTLRNLSDLISEIGGREQNNYINLLVSRLLQILYDYAKEPCITTCALGILANITCNNDAIKRYICENDGVERLITTIDFVMRDGRDLDKEILEPAVCTLCHLMNQTHPGLAGEVKKNVLRNYEMFQALKEPGSRMISSELSKAVDKLFNFIRY